LIAIVAVLGLAVDLNANETTIQQMDALEPEGPDALEAFVVAKLDYLATSRPTAVNLFSALAEVKEILSNLKLQSVGANRQAFAKAVLDHAKFMLDRDLADNRAIGQHGADAILARTGASSVRLVTICNTGALATAGYGTALGVARALQERSALQSIHALETRPYNQGSRLTAFEILEQKMPGGTLICDSAAAALMSRKGVDAVVVGADRVCANGDTANKIGTYNLSIVAAAHHVPFYVAAPFTTLDTTLRTGDEIEIEERSSEEIILSGNAPAGMPCWNPAFDVTPARYIAGIITEKGVIRPGIDGTIDVKAFVEAHLAGEKTGSSSSPKLHVPFDYVELSNETVPGYLAKNAPIAMASLETKDAKDLVCKEVGDGNLNLVFIITNQKSGKSIIVKQALPYVRCVGESWPLTLDRAFFEYKALVAEKAACPEFVPDLYYFSKPHGLIVMEYIPPPNIILRKGLIQGIRYPTMAADMGTFCAKTLFRTSGFALSETQMRNQVEFWMTNHEMCALTEQVVFTEPYITAVNNRWTSPHLDADKKAIEDDDELKMCAAVYKTKFVTSVEALIHADLHSGSVMCSPADHQTFVIDPEFAFYGPMSFDLGAFVANLFLSYVSQEGHTNGDDYAEWILQQIRIFWSTFETVFVNLWNDEREHTGMMFTRSVLSPSAAANAQSLFFASLLRDTLGFAGMKMLRRIVGISHVEDLESIENVDVRAKCERHGLEIAKALIKTAVSFNSMDDAIELAKNAKETTQY
jgi:5-methylthioribose kinase